MRNYRVVVHPEFTRYTLTQEEGVLPVVTRKYLYKYSYSYTQCTDMNDLYSGYIATDDNIDYLIHFLGELGCFNKFLVNPTKVKTLYDIKHLIEVI